MRTASSRPRRSARVTLLAVLTALTAPLASCSDPDSATPQPAAAATSPACRQLIADAPRTVLGLPRRTGDAEGVLRWGEPPVVLECGHEPPPPSTASCLGVDDVDWIITDPDADPVRFTTYGRSPAVVVRVPASYGRDRLSAALIDLADVVRALPRNGPGCD